MNHPRFLALVLIGLASACGKDDDNIRDVELRDEMRAFVIDLSTYAKAQNNNFIVIPQNGIELVSSNGDTDGSPELSYLNAIDGNGQEDLFYGYNNDNQLTPAVESQYLVDLLSISQGTNKAILVTDYCSTLSNMDNAYTKCMSQGYISFAADERDLNNIPNYPSTIRGENSNNITSLAAIENFLYLINPENFNSRADLINAISATNYDLVILDLFFNDNTTFLPSEIDALKVKSNGGSRLVIAYMSIGEAEDYRYYWDNSWDNNEPEWLDDENSDWAGNFKVKYWNEDWQSIIFGNNDSYLKKIIDANFDGVYLDIIDAYEYYE